MQFDWLPQIFAGDYALFSFEWQAINTLLFWSSDITL